jgi:hypothetical protein
MSIKAHDLPLPGSCRRSDDEVVGATRGTYSPNVRQEDTVGLGYIKVIGLMFRAGSREARPTLSPCAQCPYQVT